MKYSSVLFLFSCFLVGSSLENKAWSNTRICWNCLPSRSDQECFRTGKWQVCAKNEFCFVEQRFENGIEVHYRGCKQDASCDSLVSGDNHLPCSPGPIAKFRQENPTRPLVCRHCCFEDYCNPTKCMKETITHVNSFETNKERSKFMQRHRASYVKSIRGRKPKQEEIYYPGFGWINWPPGALKSGLAFPPFADSFVEPKAFTTGPIKKTAANCPTEVKLQKTPSFIKPPEECTITLPHSCVADGTIVLKVAKYHDDMTFKNKKSRPPPLCERTPKIETMMVYDEGDHYVIINRVNNRHSSYLPVRKRGKFFLNDIEIADYYSLETIKSYKRGLGIF